MPEHRGAAGPVRPLARAPPPRSSRPAPACGRPRWAKLSPNIDRPRRDRRRPPPSAGAEAVTLVNTVLGMAIDLERRRRPCSAPAAAGCPARPSTRSRCGPCYDVHARPARPADRRRRRRGDAATDAAELLLAGAIGGAGRHGHLRRSRGPPRGCSTSWNDWCDATAWPAVAELIGAAHADWPRPTRPRPTERRCPTEVRVTAWRWRSTSTTWSRPLRLARELQPWFGVAKVGLELYSAAGPDAIAAMLDLGFDVFCRPQAARHPHHRRQGGPGARRARRRATSRSTPHGGVGDAARRRRRAGRGRRGRGRAAAPIALAVTVLTSDADAPAAHPAASASRPPSRRVRRDRVRRARPRARPASSARA